MIRPGRVAAVERRRGLLRVTSAVGVWLAGVVVSATGSWERLFVPCIPGRERFTGRQVHTPGYGRAVDFAGQRVVVVGGGNCGAQIAADPAAVAGVTWCTLRPPRFLPDGVDGRVLFDAASARRQALDAGLPDTGGVAALGDIVAVPAVRAARDGQLLKARPVFTRLTAHAVAWADGTAWEVDAVTGCTRFPPEPAAPGSARPAR